MVNLHSDRAQIAGPAEAGNELSLDWLSSLGETLRSPADTRILARVVAERASLATGAQASLFAWMSADSHGAEKSARVTAAQVRGASDGALDEQLALWAASLPPDAGGVLRHADLWKSGPSGIDTSPSPPEDSGVFTHGAVPLRSVLSVPVSSRSGALLGRICLGHRKSSAFTHVHERIATSLALWAAISFENLSLREAAACRNSDDDVMLTLASAGIGLWQWDLDSGSISWSGGTAELRSAGYRSRGTIQDFEHTVHPEDALAVHEAITRTVRDGKGRVGFRIENFAGELRWVEWSGALVRSEDGAPRRVLGLLRDVTEQRRQREAFGFFADASEVLGRSLDVQATLRALARLAVPALGDWCVVDLVEPGAPPRRIAIEHRDPEKRAMAAALADRYPPDLESEHGVGAVLRTGKTMWISELPTEFLERVARDAEHAQILVSLGLRGYISAPLRVRDRIAGIITCVAAESARVFCDNDVRNVEELAQRAGQAIHNAERYEGLDRKERRLERQARKLARQKSELEKIQAELREAYEDLSVRARDYQRMSIAEKEANRAKSDFLASMSHELRTPLNAISGYVELLELGIRGPLTDAQREDLSRIRRSQQALLSLINDILNFSRLEAGEVPFAVESVPLRGLIADLDPLIRPRAEAKKITLEIDDPASPVTALADPERLTQVFLNLLSNAVKYTDNGGAIVISSRGTPTHALVTIRDTGCGISEARLPHVFDPFVKVESVPSNRQQGVGLGLAISRDIVRAMNGHITVRSEVGRGSEFTVSLPRADLQGQH